MVRLTKVSMIFRQRMISVDEQPRLFFGRCIVMVVLGLVWPVYVILAKVDNE